MNNHSPTIRVVKILDLVSQHNQDGLKLSEIVSMLDIPKTTVFNIVNTLVKEEILEEQGDIVKVYHLGFKAFMIGNKYSENVDIVNISGPWLKELSEQTKMTSFIAKYDHLKMVYIFKYEPRGALITTANIGSKNYLHCSALGKAYLSTLDDETLNHVCNQLTYKKLTKNTIVHKEDLIKEIKKVKTNGYSIDNREIEDHMICFGAPVYNHLGEFEASVSLTALYNEKIDTKRCGQHIKQVANKISAKLGYQKGDDTYEI